MENGRNKDCIKANCNDTAFEFARKTSKVVKCKRRKGNSEAVKRNAANDELDILFDIGAPEAIAEMQNNRLHAKADKEDGIIVLHGSKE